MTKFHDAHEAFLKWAEGKPDWSRASSNAKDWAWRAWQSCWKPAPSHLEWSGGGELKQIREALESVTNREASRFYRETMVEHALAALSRLEAREAEIPTEHNNYYGGESAAVLAVALANGVRVVSEQLIWWMRDEIERAVQARIAAAPSRRRRINEPSMVGTQRSGGDWKFLSAVSYI